MFHGQQDVMCTSAPFLSLSFSPLLLYVCLSVWLYLFISAICALLFTPLDICQYGLDRSGPCLSPLKWGELAMALKTDL